MEKIILYHGTSDKNVVPQYGLGEEKHDYGKVSILLRMLNLQKSGLFVNQMKRTDGFISTNWILLI